MNLFVRLEDLLWLEIVDREDGRLNEEIVERVEVTANWDVNVDVVGNRTVDVVGNRIVVGVRVGTCTIVLVCPDTDPEQTSPFGQQPIIPLSAIPQ